MIWRPSPCCFLSALVVRMVVPCLAWKDPFCFEWSGRDNPWPFSFQSQFSDLRFFWMLRSHCPEDSQQENRDDDRGSTDAAAVFAGHLPYYIIRKQSKRKIQCCQKSEDQKITKTANNNKIPPSGWKKYFQNVLQYRTVTGRPRKSGACFSVSAPSGARF